MSNLDRADFFYKVTTISTAVVCGLTLLFLVLAFFSPEINLDLPGNTGFNGGGVGGD